MEEFFKQSILERLYDSLSVEFEESLLNDKNEYKKYQDITKEEEKLYNMLKEIVENDKDKLSNLMNVITEIEDYCCKETEYWNKKYFKLGFTYMVSLENPKDFTKSEKDNFSLQVHNFLDDIRIKDIDKNKKILLVDFVNNLKNGTEKQKRRFLMYYNLMPNSDKVLSYTDIAKMEGCSISAIKSSIISIVSYLVRIEDSQKSLFLTIMNEIDIKI